MLASLWFAAAAAGSFVGAAGQDVFAGAVALGNSTTGQCRWFGPGGQQSLPAAPLPGAGPSLASSLRLWAADPMLKFPASPGLPAPLPASPGAAPPELCIAVGEVQPFQLVILRLAPGPAGPITVRPPQPDGVAHIASRRKMHQRWRATHSTAQARKRASRGHRGGSAAAQRSCSVHDEGSAACCAGLSDVARPGRAAGRGARGSGGEGVGSFDQRRVFRCATPSSAHCFSQQAP